MIKQPWNRLVPCAHIPIFLILALGLIVSSVQSQQRTESGSYIPFETYSLEQDQTILERFGGLRVADVSDAMDRVGLMDVGLMDPQIRPLWRDLDDFSHQIRGIAVTVRYVPTNKRAPTLPLEEFRRWQNEWYEEISPERFEGVLRDGSVVVIDATGDRDTGSVGSLNTMVWKSKGALGVITSAGVRDTDEIIKEKIPVYYTGPKRGYPPGRTEIESVNRPITCGGVLVRPGDVVVADGDGVIVVPREHSEAVATEARRILEADKKARRGLYEQLGLPLDPTVQ